MACGEIAFRRDSRRGGPFSVIPAAAAVSNAASRLSGMEVYRRVRAPIEFKFPVSFPFLPLSFLSQEKREYKEHLL